MTKDRETRLATRLKKYAAALAVLESEVLSLKLRPVMPGAQYTDPFGHQDANAYLYESEYRAGRATCNLGTLDPRIDAQDLHVGHPLPWSRDPSEFVRTLDDASSAVWIQHETGLEIVLLALEVAANVATMAAGLATLYEVIRKKVSANAKSNESDRYYKEVTRIRIEVRQMDGGELKQELIVAQDVHKSFDVDELGKLLSVVFRANK